MTVPDRFPTSDDLLAARTPTASLSFVPRPPRATRLIDILTAEPMSPREEEALAHLHRVLDEDLA